MSRNKELMLLILTAFLIAILLSMLSFNTDLSALPSTSNPGSTSPSPSPTPMVSPSPSSSPSSNPNGNQEEAPPSDLFVVPESPLGTLGLLSAVAVAFGIFALRKSHSNLPLNG